MRHRTHTGGQVRRATIAMNADDVQLLDDVYRGLKTYFKLDEDKPTLSAILMVTLKRNMEGDPDFLRGLFRELQRACQNKANPWKDYAEVE